MTRFRNIVGTPLYGTLMSMEPAVPKVASSWPSLTRSAASLRPAVKNRRAGVAPSPGQYATPRLDGVPTVGGPAGGPPAGLGQSAALPFAAAACGRKADRATPPRITISDVRTASVAR